MDGVEEAGLGGALLERGREFDQIDACLQAAVMGEGRVLLVEGPPGIGKTALLEVASHRARDIGMSTLSARGEQLERHFPYGIVRQLFEPPLRRLSAADRRVVLSGAARLAVRVVTGKPEIAGGEGANAGSALARMHGLYWLAVNLSQKAPVMITVDDVQWSDEPSMRFLLFLLRRLGDIPLTLAMSARSGERGSESEVGAQLATEANVRSMRPGALSEQAVAHVVRAGLGRAPHGTFTAACRAATGGVPFLVHQLVAALGADNISPTAENAAKVSHLGPRSVARASLGRVEQSHPGSTALAQAISVLGREALLPRVAQLAGMEDVAALKALDALVSGHVVAARERLEFVHPILRAAVYEELLPGRRSSLHRKAAALLAAEGVDMDLVAAQLLASEPTGSEEVARDLESAAASALTRGAPEDAVAYLIRALREVRAGQSRARLLYQLARAERLLGQASAIEHLEEAHRLAGDPVLRSGAALELAGLLGMTGQWEKPFALIDAALEQLGDGVPGLYERLERSRAGLSAYDPRLVSEYDRRLPRLRQVAAGDSIGAKSIALLVANIAAFRGAPGPGDAALLCRRWDVGELLSAGMDEWALDQGLSALVVSEELGHAGEAAEAMLVSARSRGSLFSFVAGTAFRGWIQARHGNLGAAEGEIRAALEPACEIRFNFALPFLFWSAIDVLLERPDAADMAALTEKVEPGPMAEVCNGAMLLDARGRIRYAAGYRTDAIHDMRAAGTIFNALGFRNPNATNWRSALALMLRSDDPAEGYRLAGEELDDARRVGHPRGIGVALRALGLVAGSDGARHLEEAVAVLQGSPARLDLARAMVDLGATLRRGGHRSAAREPLRAGLDLAATSGATRLANRASAELAAAGARPRRPRATGVEALTPSELRVAQLAAEGRTNNEVAQALFITPKTVDTHLTRAYAKLGISSRQALASAMAIDAAAIP